MAGAGYKLFNTGDVLTAAQVNTYLMEQTVMRFATTTARDTALSGVLAEGMLCYIDADNNIYKYTGSAWVNIDTTGGGSPLTTKGDLYTYSTTDARLAVGNNGETLVADSSTSTGLRYQSGVNTNGVINGGFDIWQRGTSFTAAGVYSADRWKKDDQTVTTLSRQSSGLTGFTYCARAQRNSGSTSGSPVGIIYSMETLDSLRFANQTVVLSFYARVGSNFSATSSAISFFLATGTGTDQSRTFSAAFTGEANPISSSVTGTTSWQRFSATATLASTTNEIAIALYFNPTGTAGANDYLEITGVQLELGAVPTAFKRAGNTLAGELAACQRYFLAIGGTGNAANYVTFGIGAVTATNGGVAHVNFPVTMRTQPSNSVSGNTAVTTSAGAINALTALSLDVSGNQSATMNFTAGTSNLTAGHATRLLANNDSTARLNFSAEL